METGGSLSPSGPVGSATLAGSLGALSPPTTEGWATSRGADPERALEMIQALGIVLQQTTRDGRCPLSALGLGAP